MPSYSYIAKSFSGEKKSGVLEAKNINELAKILKDKGYVLISVENENEIKERDKIIKYNLFLFKKVSLKEKIFFTRNLRVMISSGISLPRALETIALQIKNKNFKNVILTIFDDITKGKSFSEALSKHPDVFSDIFVNMVKVGEEGGTLENVLDILTEQMEKYYELKSKIAGALIYPAVIISAMIIIGMIMITFVVPTIAKTFKELEIDLPLTTTILISLGNFMSNYWYFVILAFFIFILFLRLALKTNFGKLIFDGILLKTPLISSLVKKSNSATTARILSSLIKAGVPMTKSLAITSGTLKNIYYKKAIENFSKDLEKGFKLSELFNKHQSLYSPLFVQMASVGEEAGELEKMLEELASFLEEDVANTTKNLSSVIEPFLMLIIGAFVGFFAVSMIQPIYGMLNAIK
jgi:type IV pilus assembly protein PilC